MFVYKSLKHLNKLNLHEKLIRITQPCKFLGFRKFSDVPRKFVTFDEVIAQRRAEARRSLVVQVNSESSFEELYGYCSKYTEINGVHHYRNTADEHFMLIEFRSEQNLEEVLRNCSSHQADSEIMALQSPFLWFRSVAGKRQKLTVPKSKSLAIEDGNAVADDYTLYEELRKSSSVSEQIQLLYDSTSLNDLGVRLRFMVARQLECVFSSLYANIAVRPFGSSVNGFGKMGCDVDLSLTNLLTVELCDPSKRLVYQEKRGSAGRGPWQRHVQLLGELLELRVAGARRVQRVVHARVPIVKYAHDLAAVECDLCYNNMSGVYMSELLWQCGALDPRVRRLAGALRRWAAAAALTSPHPGTWLTNFSLTLLVLFFLQQPGIAVLPPVKLLVERARDEDKRIAEDNMNCTFLRDLNLLPPDTYGQSEASLETLLVQFFEFYAQFDFEDQAVSIIEGTPVRKPTFQPLYIVNPLEKSLNVSRNVNLKECERLRMEMKNAAWQLEACMDGQKTDSWGLLSILENYSARTLKKLIKVGNSHRLVSIKDLFKDDEEDEPKRLTQKSVEEVESSVKEMKEMLQENKVTNKNEKVKFKNSHVAGQVNRIVRNKLS